MPDVVRALLISSAILTPVVVLIVIISIAAVKRGEAGQHEAVHSASESAVHAQETAAPAAAAAAKAAKPAAAASDEISIAQILIYGVGLFVVTVLLLLGLSLIQHLG